MKIEKSKFQSKENIYMYDLKYRIILHIIKFIYHIKF